MYLYYQPCFGTLNHADTFYHCTSFGGARAPLPRTIPHVSIQAEYVGNQVSDKVPIDQWYVRSWASACKRGGKRRVIEYSGHIRA